MPATVQTARKSFCAAKPFEPVFQLAFHTLEICLFVYLTENGGNFRYAILLNDLIEKV